MSLRFLNESRQTTDGKKLVERNIITNKNWVKRKRILWSGWEWFHCKIHDVIYHVSEITYSTSKQQNYTALKCSGIDCEIDTFYSWLPKHSKGITKLFTEYPLGINKNEIAIQKLRPNSCNNFIIQFSLFGS